MSKKVRDGLITLVGLALLGLGLYLVKAAAQPQGVMRALPFVLVGVGCGTFGSGMGNLIGARAMRKNPALRRQMEINETDERNVAIANRAKAKAYDMMVFVFGALMLSYALMTVDLAAVLLLVCAYLFVIFYGVYWRVQYEKKM